MDVEDVNDGAWLEVYDQSVTIVRYALTQTESGGFSCTFRL